MYEGEVENSITLEYYQALSTSERLQLLMSKVIKLQSYQTFKVIITHCSSYQSKVLTFH